MKYTTQQLIESVREYALGHYFKDGWDIVVDTWDDSYLIAVIDSLTTPKAVISRVHEITKELDKTRRSKIKDIIDV